jgi:hypothetical protein
MKIRAESDVRKEGARASCRPGPDGKCRSGLRTRTLRAQSDATAIRRTEGTTSPSLMPRYRQRVTRRLSRYAQRRDASPGQIECAAPTARTRYPSTPLWPPLPLSPKSGVATAKARRCRSGPVRSVSSGPRGTPAPASRSRSAGSRPVRSRNSSTVCVSVTPARTLALSPKAEPRDLLQEL